MTKVYKHIMQENHRNPSFFSVIIWLSLQVEIFGEDLLHLQIWGMSFASEGYSSFLASRIRLPKKQLYPPCSLLLLIHTKKIHKKQTKSKNCLIWVSNLVLIPTDARICPSIHLDTWLHEQKLDVWGPALQVFLAKTKAKSWKPT